MIKYFYLNAFVFLTATLFCYGCATQQQVKTDVDSRSCIKNYSEGGGFWVGTTYKSYQEFSKVTKQQAFQRVVTFLASEGWSLTNTNKELGIISASQSVSYGQGKSCPVNVVIKNRASGGIRVEAFVKTSGGVVYPGCDQFLCNLLTAVSK